MDQKLRQSEKNLKRSIAAHFSIDLISFYFEICRIIGANYTLIKQCIEFGTFDDNENEHNLNQQKIIQSSSLKINAEIINQIKRTPNGIFQFAIKETYQWYKQLDGQFEENVDDEKSTKAYEDEKTAWFESGQRSEQFLNVLVESKHPKLLKILQKYCEVRRRAISN